MPRKNARIGNQQSRSRSYSTSSSSGGEDGSVTSSDGGRSSVSGTTEESVRTDSVTSRLRNNGRVRQTCESETAVVETRGTRGGRYGWCGTWNNPPEPDALLLEYLTRYVYNQVDYFIGQIEVGSGTGTRHLQFYFEVPNRRTRSSVIKIFHFSPELTFSPHLEPKSKFSTFTQARNYCRKEDSREQDGARFEYGEFRGDASQGRRRDLEEVAKLARGGGSYREIGEKYPTQLIRYSNGIKFYKSIFTKYRDWVTEVYWFWGGTGTGKSRAARELMPNAYWKDGSHKWWDGYDGHEDVIIDDFRYDDRDSTVRYSYWLNLCDRYPFQVQTKGGSCQFLGRRIVFTSIFSVQSAFASVDEPITQMLRRIKEIRHFTSEATDLENNIFNE